jgi:hypothetical protein
MPSRPQRQSIRSLIGDQQVAAEEERPAAPVAAAPVVVTQPERREAVVETIQTAAQDQPAAEEVQRMKTGFTLRKDLLKSVKRLAVEEEVDINVLLEEGMQLLLDSRQS